MDLRYFKTLIEDTAALIISGAKQAAFNILTQFDVFCREPGQYPFTFNFQTYKSKIINASSFR